MGVQVSMVIVDQASNPFGQRPAVVCDRCGLGMGGLMRDGERFVHRDETGCDEARRLAEEGWDE